MKKNSFRKKIGLKSIFEQIGLWKIITNSDLYKKRKNPEAYKAFKNELAFYRKLLKKIQSDNDLIFDIGANVGNKSVIFSKLTNKVIAFEPSKKLYRNLKNRFKGSNVKLYNCALGNSVKELDFYIVENNEAYNSLSKKHIETTVTNRGIANKENVKLNKVQVETIENFIKKFGTPKYIKIDVEGYEYEVIKGLKSLVPLLSFEANLPEFCVEAIQSIDYLDTLSTHRYKFNFITANSFINECFKGKDETVAFLINTKLQYLEIYAKLDFN